MKMHLPKICLLIALFMLFVGAPTAQTGAPNDKDAEDVRAAFRRMVAAFNARDAKAALSFFSRDALLVHPLRGENDFQTISRSFEEGYRKPPAVPFRVIARIEEIRVSGETAFLRIVWEREKIDDKKIIAGEKDLEIWTREADGNWRLARGYSFPLEAGAPNWSKEEAQTFAGTEDAVDQSKRKTDAAQDVAALRAAFEKVRRSYNERDSNARMSLYSKDSLLTYPGEPDAGFEQTRKNYERSFASLPASPVDIFYEIEEIKISGDLAFVRVTWFVGRAADKKILSRLKDLEIWRREGDGQWKLFRGLSFHLKPE